MSIQDQASERRRPNRQARRSRRPERLTIGGEMWVRNDILAKEVGTTERALNRGDAQGAPFVFVAGIKYRPERQYHEFLTSRIQVKGKSVRKRAVAGAL
jgi:hypothetical protein